MGRKKHSKELKASIALDAIKGQNQQTVRLAGTTTIILLPAQGFTFESNENLELMRLIDEEFLRHPFYGSRKIRDYLNRQGFPVNRKRVQRLMRLMGIESVAPKPNTSRPRKEHKVYPYLRENCRSQSLIRSGVPILPISGWDHGFVYLTAVMD